MSNGQLLGKVALVTGAGSGIGRATCQLLARDGAKVIATDINLASAERTASSLKTDSLPVELNVCSLESVQKALQRVFSHYQQPATLVVNCAGITKDTYLLKMSPKDYDDVISINLRGTFLVMQKTAQAMIEHNISKGGSIINLSSIVAKINNIGQCNYAASKAGVISMTSVASKEFGKFGIRVNAVLPGYINTPMTEIVPDIIKQQTLLKCPLQRFGEPEEVAEVITFLASEKASFINGAAIEVTGGLS